MEVGSRAGRNALLPVELAMNILARVLPAYNWRKKERELNMRSKAGDCRYMDSRVRVLCRWRLQQEKVCAVTHVLMVDAIQLQIRSLTAVPSLFANGRTDRRPQLCTLASPIEVVRNLITLRYSLYL